VLHPGFAGFSCGVLYLLAGDLDLVTSERGSQKTARERIKMIQPSDIFLIQAAIEKYERKHPDSPTPSAEVALAWQMDRSHKRTQRSAPT
jgi:hypothetical protein